MPRLLAAAALALPLTACPWPAGLPEAAAPGRAPSGAVYPDLRADLGPRDLHRRDAAVIVSVADYTRMPDRAGAHAMAAAWYDYFRRTRGLRPWRIKLLRDGEVTTDKLKKAIDDARWWVDHKSTLWFVFVGHISGAPDDYGALWLPVGDGTAATADTSTAAISDVLSRLDHGHHMRTVAVFDGCMPPGLLPAGTDTPALPLQPLPESKGLVRTAPSMNNSLALLLGETIAQARQDVDRSRRTPSDLSLFGAGHGDGCVARLPGTDFPALSYLVLGGLRGWADADRDGDVTAVEAITGAHDMLHTAAPGTPARPSLFTADIVLARGAFARAPDLHLPPGAHELPVVTSPAPPPRIVMDDMIRVDGGAFRMGCPDRRDPDCEKDERPANRVVLSRFFIDPREATVADYARCVARGKCSDIDMSRCFVWTGSEFKKGEPLPEPLTRPDHPIVCLNWYQAARYCESIGKQLPTEAEWERAAAGTTRRKFPWGDGPPTCALAHHDGCGEHTHPVGAHPDGATPEGVHDLSGNVAEWVHDWYAKSIYWDFRKADPVGPLRGDVKVVRGGSYYEGASTLRNSYRYGLNPGSGFSTVGVRCSR